MLTTLLQNLIEFTEVPGSRSLYFTLKEKIATEGLAFAQFHDTIMPFLAHLPMQNIRQWIDDLGNPEIPINPFQPEHNALSSARWNKAVYRWLTQYHVHSAWRVS